MELPQKMKAAILVETGQPLVVDEVDLPSDLEAGQVLVKLSYSGICGSQIGEIDAVKGPDKWLPHLLGHEGSGEVVALGAGVRTVSKGDTVVLHWKPAPGIEAAPAAYQWQGKRLNAGWVTTFNEYAIVAENRVTAVPAQTDLVVAALFGCAVTTGFGVVTNDANLRIGESVVVFGAGGVGLNVVQAAAMNGAYPVIAVDLHDNRLKLAKKMGATHTINGSKSDAVSEIGKIVEPGTLDCFIDNTGVPAVIQSGYELIHGKGRVILVGVPRAGNNINIYSLPMHFGKRFYGSHGGDAAPEIDIPRYMKLVDAGRMQLKELVTNTYPLDGINDAINAMRDGSAAGRCVIKF
ncbi:MAG: zinc-binding dehydrogenase [Pseudomonadota bacterium]